ncbi:MAG: glutamine--fructose-6-phosphate transaminase (isomerizing) [Zestosphaera sp.]
MVCGIIGVTASEDFLTKPLGEIIKEALKKLEYRGYDSVGFAIMTRDRVLEVRKSRGMIDAVAQKLKFDLFTGIAGIGHTRWATHGAPSDENAHPHTDCSGRIAVVHNGIIENHRELREFLTTHGHRFRSDTDTEVLPHLIEFFKGSGHNPYEAFKKSVGLLKGAYAVVVMDVDEPDKLFFARNTSPLIIGVGTQANFIASDVVAFMNFTKKVIVLQDGEVGYVTPDTILVEEIRNENGIVVWRPVNVEPRIRTIEWTPEMATKGGYEHFMIKEIYEQPYALASTLSAASESVEGLARFLTRSERVILLGAGTSYHAALLAALLLRKYAGVWAEALVSSESPWWINRLREGDVVIGVSQSGETIDTLKGIREARARGAVTVAVTNVVGSTIARESDLTAYIRAGPEIGVAATKTFTSQVALLSYLALRTGELSGFLSPSDTSQAYKSLQEVPRIASSILEEVGHKAIWLSSRIHSKSSMYYLGRGLGLPIAMEGALKLKEIAYVHAEAYPAGESKHGPIALIENDFPVLFVVLNKDEGDLIKSNIEEMRARGAQIIVVSPRNVEDVLALADMSFKMPALHEVASATTYVIPLQILAYHTAIRRGLDPDKPRNLAKTVTVF